MQDLYLLTEGLNLVAAAENWEPRRTDTPVGVVPPSRGSDIDPVAQAATAGSGLSTGSAISPPPATSTAVTALPEYRIQQDRHTDPGAEIDGDIPPPSSMLAGQYGKADGGIDNRAPADTRAPVLTESEAWERVAREVRSLSCPVRRCLFPQLQSHA